MKSLAIVLLLAVTCQAQLRLAGPNDPLPTIRLATEQEMIDSAKETEAHPDRWRWYRDKDGKPQASWFMRGPMGDDSMRRFEKMYPNVQKGKPPGHDDNDKMIAARHKLLTGREYVPLHKQVTGRENDLTPEQERLSDEAFVRMIAKRDAITLAEAQVKVAGWVEMDKKQRAEAESAVPAPAKSDELAAMRAEVKRLLARIEELERAK